MRRAVHAYFETKSRVGSSVRLLSAATLTAALVATACQDPTEIVLEISTNLQCTDAEHWRGIAVYTGTPGAELEKKSPVLVSSACDANGYVGNVVIAPSGNKDEQVGVRVVAGLSRNPEECEGAGYAGCIVARRTLRFAAHQSLELDVALVGDCVSQGCDATHTCVNARCVGSTVDAVESALPPLDESQASVQCGEDGVRCATTGDVCCLTVDGNTTHGRCVPSSQCTKDEVVLNCDDDDDCPPINGEPATCWLSVDFSQKAVAEASWMTPERVALSGCIAESSLLGAQLLLCQDRQLCRGGKQCMESSGHDGAPSALPHYYWCPYYYENH